MIIYLDDKVHSEIYIATLTIDFIQGVLSDCCALFERHYDGTL